MAELLGLLLQLGCDLNGSGAGASLTQLQTA
jgi:hypothetical protein